MIGTSATILVILLGYTVQVCQGKAYLSLKFLTFYNPGGKGSNGHCCDGKWIFCVTECDHAFTVCVDQVDGPASNFKHCTYGSKYSGKIRDRDVIRFGSSVGRLQNPIVYDLDSWPGEVQLKIEIIDVDGNSNNDDHVGYLSRDIRVQPSRSQRMTQITIRNRVQLTLGIRVYCESNYYGPKCDIRCEPTDSQWGHYDCNQYTGAKDCHEGWTGAACTVNVDDCVGVVCENGGSCQDLHNKFQCACAPGYEGRLCEFETDECMLPSVCEHGECLNTPGSFNCRCHPGYEGARCDLNTDECADAPCRNGGVCIDLIGNFTCVCSSGYQGVTCSDDVDECGFDPCLNNATCINGHGTYSCHCLQGYHGNHCEHDVDECSTLPCDNSGTCINLPGTYTCACASGFEGHSCAQDVDECVMNTTLCLNNGTCHNTYGNYSCACPPGYEGRHCQLDVNECDKNPCEQGGTCHNVEGSFHCSCATGWSGVLCNENIDECALGVCANGGTCYDYDGSFSCECTEFWEGRTCEDNVDECSYELCLNGGTCVNIDEGFVCSCPEGLTGRYCDDDVNECERVGLCGNNANCSNNFGGFFCDCPPGWEGPTCMDDVDECLQPENCLNSGICSNTRGGYICECPANWTGDACELDVNECMSAIGNNSCRNNGTCENLIGSFQCNCTAGWDGLLCDIDVNECAENANICEPAEGVDTVSNYSNNATNTTSALHHFVCLNTQPGYLCTCAPGWTGDRCDQDIDECLVTPSSSGILPVSTSNNSRGVYGRHENSTPGEGYDGDPGEMGFIISLGHDLSIPLNLSCPILTSMTDTVDTALMQVFLDSKLFDGQKLVVEHSLDHRETDEGELVTSVHPIIYLDGLRLSDYEVGQVLRTVSNRTMDSLLCTNLGTKGPHQTFRGPADSSDDEGTFPAWYAALITASLLLLVAGIVFLVVRSNMHKRCRRTIYRVRSSKRKVLSDEDDAYTDSIYVISQMDNQHHQPERCYDVGLGGGVTTFEQTETLVISNPLYGSLEEDLPRTDKVPSRQNSSPGHSVSSQESARDGQPSI